MQKKLIALAVAGLVAAPAFAQSNVTITGIATASYNNYKVLNSSRTTAAENRLDDNTSRFTIKGSEDLGGGLSAYFQMENRVSLDTRPNATFGNAQGLGDGESFVGLKHNKLGSIGFGKYAMQYHEGMGYSETYRALNTGAYASAGILGQNSGSYLAGSTRQQNTIKYDSPVWAGFSFKAAYSFSNFGNEGTLTNTSAIGGCTTQYGGCATSLVTGRPTAAAATDNSYNKGYGYNVGGRYFANGINVYAGYYEFKPENGTRAAGQEDWRLHADYAFPFGLQVGFGFDKFTVEGATSATDVKRNAWMIPVSYGFGAHKVYLTYAKAEDSKVGSTKANNTGASQLVLAYDYAFSKRTFAGVSYFKLSNDSNASYTPWLYGISTLGGSGLIAGEKARAFSVNLTHFF